MSLTHKSLLAFLWSGADVFLRQGLKFLVGIMLARLLTPEDFGVIAMLYVFIGVADVFIDSGFSSSLIQRQDITDTDQYTVFLFNLGMGAIAAITLCGAAPWIALFFKSSILENLSYVMAMNLFIGALGSIHSTLLTKELNFRTITKVGGMATLFSGMLAVIMAWRGFGVWSLAWQTVASSVITVVLLWYWHPWRPRWEFKLYSLSRLFRFGGFMMISGLLEALYTQLYALLIGKLYTARELGFYTRATNTQQFPVSILTSVLNRVAFPVFSVAATDPVKLAKGLRKLLMLIMFFNIPAMLGLAAVAEPFVVMLFGTKWLPSVPFLQVFCLAGVLVPLSYINLNVLMAQGRSDLFFRLEVIKKIICVFFLVLASLHSIMAIAWIQPLIGLIVFFINAYYSGVLLGYGPWCQLRDIMPFGLVAMIMAIIVDLTSQLLHWTSVFSLLPIAEWVELLQYRLPVFEFINQLQQWSPASQFASLSVLGATFYFVTCSLLRLAAFNEFSEIIVQLNSLRLKPIKAEA